MNQRHFGGKLSSSLYYAVPGPDLEIRGRGSSRPLDGGGGWFPKNFFWPFRSQFGLKIRVGGRAPPLDPPLLQILSKNVVVVEASSQMSGKKNLQFNIALVLDSKGILIFLKRSTSPVESISL